MTSRDPRTQASPWYRRLHAALMPDYNVAASTYWWLATSVGALLLLWCLLLVSSLPAPSILQIAAGTLFAIGAGLFPVRIPGTRVSFGVGELIIFLVLLLHGPAAAAVLAAAEAAVGSHRTSKRWTSRLGSPAMATLAMYTAASLFEAARAALASGGDLGAVPLLAVALVTGLVYFILSATLMGGVARLRRGEHLFRPSDLLGAFRWVGLAYAGSAMFATLLYIVYLQAGAGVLWVMVPLLVMLLLVLHFFYRQQEAQEAMRSALADIARREEAMQAREAETTARHERELQLSERRFRGAFTYAAIGMVLLDLEGRVIQSNEALSRLLGRRTEELLGSGFAGLLHADDRDLFVSRLATARDVHFNDFDQEFRLLGAGGHAQRVRAHCSFFRGPAAHGAALAGKPCLILQVQTLERANGPDE
jgi:PAS domain S-box-containing protein